jgi:acyl-CoA thioester hydrolase
MRALGMSYRVLEENGVMLPVSHFEVDYFKPALYDDLLTVETAIVEVKGPRIFFEYTLYNELRVCLSKGKTTLVFVSKDSMKPIAPPVSFLGLIEQYTVAHE